MAVLGRTLITLGSVNNLSLDLSKQCKYIEAETYQQTLKDNERPLCQGIPIKLICISQLGLVLSQLGMMDNEVLERALVRVKSYWNSH